ncbi:sulfotransferase [Candidatus Albibeggiatoa sp. nov. BB20]|uniref:sulfotransferase n=1 Tax=Candidatus Albibeggiatoa sp. nov. BB20 TaxID=3162723 RepID=UPI00336547C5
MAQKSQLWKVSLGHWDECLSRFPSEKQMDWLINRAEVLLCLDRYTEAETAFSTLIQHFPNTYEGYSGLGLIAQNLKNWELALKYWNFCIQHFPDKKLWVANWLAYKAKALRELGHTVEQRTKTQKHNLNYSSLLIITYGRTGSTLLQGVLNSVDGVLIRGENNNLIFHLFQSYKTILQNKQEQKYENKAVAASNHPWYGANLPDESLFLNHIQSMLHDLLLADKIADSNIECYGFKEIRYIDIAENLLEYLDFLNKVFPNVAFIFNTRQIDDVMKSGWWKNQSPEEIKHKMTQIEHLFNQYAETHANCFQICYEDVVANGDKVQALFEFIGAEYSSSQIDQVLSIPHSCNPTQEHIQSLFEKK